MGLSLLSLGNNVASLPIDLVRYYMVSVRLSNVHKFRAFIPDSVKQCEYCLCCCLSTLTGQIKSF